jgi:hypothetical protein
MATAVFRTVAMLFGLAWIAIGSSFGVEAFRSIADFRTAQSFVPVQAEVLNVKLVCEDSAGHTRGLSQHPTCLLTARYRYEYAGRRYESGLLDVSHGLQTVPATLGPDLEAAREAHRPITVYFDPQRPANAVFDRSLPFDVWALDYAGALVYTAVGALFVALALLNGAVVAWAAAGHLVAAAVGFTWFILTVSREYWMMVTIDAVSLGLAAGIAYWILQGRRRRAIDAREFAAIFGSAEGGSDAGGLGGPPQ